MKPDGDLCYVSNRNTARAIFEDNFVFKNQCDPFSKCNREESIMQGGLQLDVKYCSLDPVRVSLLVFGILLIIPFIYLFFKKMISFFFKKK